MFLFTSWNNSQLVFKEFILEKEDVNLKKPIFKFFLQELPIEKFIFTLLIIGRLLVIFKTSRFHFCKNCQSKNSFSPFNSRKVIAHLENFSKFFFKQRRYYGHLGHFVKLTGYDGLTLAHQVLVRDSGSLPH